ITPVLAAAVALADPLLIVVGGAWGPALAGDIDEHFRRGPRPVPLSVAALADPELTGARARAVEELRALVVRTAHPADTRPTDHP
ncbi:ROK family transcriptional regulator, partial [Streptomyces sp. SID14478]|nr:ROK family transcriptional regulator [Streptomyces sp. SID14478]